MARMFGPRAGRRNRSRVYSVLGVLVVFVVFAYIYGPFGNSDSEPLDSPTQMHTETSVSISDDDSAPAANDNTTAQPSTAESQPETRPEPIRETNIPVREVVSTESIINSNTEAGALINEAMKLLDQNPGEVIEARDKLNKALRMSVSNQQKNLIKEQMSKLSDQWLFSRTIFPGDELCESYKVQSLEILDIIGKRNKVPYEILMEINKISNPKSLQAGQNLKVVHGPFHAKVYRSTFTMDIYLQNTYVKTYPVGLGKTGSETPTGLWRVEPGGKLIKPIWTNPLDGRTYYPDDEDYPLGSRWIALEGISGSAKDRTGFAIHGTKEPEQIGKAGSQGCIRMHNGSAVLVYNMLFPALSTVEVID